MHEFIRFMNQGWVGTIVGTAGLALALLLYWRSRISGIIAFQSHNVSMIGGGKALFPAEVEVRYRETPVPGLTSSTVWIWNAGKKTVEGADVVKHDPLQLRFGGEVLNVKIIKVTREVLHIKADKSEDTSEEGRRTIYCGFEFLDPGDGGVVEVLHTGSAEAPKCIGTIKKLPEGIQDWGRAWGASASSRRRRNFDLIMSPVMLVFGLGLCVIGILGEQYIEEALPFLTEPPELQFPSWLQILGRGIAVLTGLSISLFSGFFLRFLLHRTPSSLDVD